MKVFNYLSMEKFEKTFCKLCLNVINDENFKFIEETTKEMLDVLLLKLSVEDKIKPVICSDCSIKLFVAFEFKVTCKYTENTIFPYVSSENAAPVDLKEVYVMEKGKEYLRSLLEYEKICRLCMKIVMGRFKSLNEVDADMLLRYIPELNFSSTKDPVICSHCFDSLNTHSSFLKKCLNLQEKIETNYQDETAANLFGIKTEEIEIKSEDGESSAGVHFNDEEPVEVEFKTEDKKFIIAQKYKCEMCDYESKYKNNIKLHELKHKDLSQVQVYICDTCNYTTKRKHNLRQHNLRHRDPSKLRMYKCDKCDFQTKYTKSHLFHQLRHKDASEVQMYGCDVCNYKSNRKDNLVLHQRAHKDISEVTIYKCDMCNYETRYKDLIKRHLLRHKDFSEVRVYKCDTCDFKTKHLRSLMRHQLMHKKL